MSSEPPLKNANNSPKTEAVIPPSAGGLETVHEEEEVLLAAPAPNAGATDQPSSRSVSNPSLLKSLKTLESILSVESGTKTRYALIGAIAAAIGTRSMGEILLYKLTSEIDELVVNRPSSIFEKSIDKKTLLMELLSQFLILGIPLSVAQQVQNFTSSRLSGKLREGLVHSLMKRLVLSPHNLCHPEELVDPNRLDALMNDINQVSVLAVQLTTDRARRYCDIIAQLMVLMKLTGSVKIPAIMIAYLVLAVSVVARQKMYKSMFTRKVNENEIVLKKFLARLSRHRDSVAAWEGAQAELATVNRLVGNVEQAKSLKDRFEFLHGLCSSLCSRVGGTALGFALIGLHFVSAATSNGGNRKTIFEYFWTGRVMLQLCNSFSTLIEEDVVLKAATSDSTPASVPLLRVAQIVKRLKASLVDLPKQLPSIDQLPYRVRKNNMNLNDVTALAMDGTVLFQSLSFEISPGGCVLVHGPKGAGKTALLRLMAGTWPIVMGEVSRPRNGVTCILSKPYLLSDASLKDQIVYPDSNPTLVDTDQLNTAVRIARISHLFEKETRMGSSVLMEQDQQKLMIARLVYHRPKYALLDDCFKTLDADHFSEIVQYLSRDCHCGVVIACSPQVADGLKKPESKLKFDVEIILSSNKQPPRHEIIVNRSSS